MSYVRDRIDDLQKIHHEDETTNSKEKKSKKLEKKINEYLGKCGSLRLAIDNIRENTFRANDILLNKQFYKLEDLQNDINPIIKVTEDECIKLHGKLKEMAIKTEDLQKDPSAETKMKYMQYTTLKEEFQDVINKHIECVKRYEIILEEIKKRVQQSIQGENFIDTQEIIDEQQAFIGNYLLEKHTAELQLRDIQERHNQLLEIENQLKEVRELFVKIAILVEQQQESINRAEHHATLSSRTVEFANEELAKAKTSKKKAFRIKTVLIIAAIIVVLIIILLIFK